MNGQISREFENCNLHLNFFNWNSSVNSNSKGKQMKIGGRVVKTHLEGKNDKKLPVF